MRRQPRTLKTVCVGLFALTVLGALPATAAAGTIGFRNDLSIPIIVQGESMVNGMLRRGQPLLIAPRKCSYDLNLPPGPRRIAIYDANNPNRVLLRITLPYDGSDVNFRVVFIPATRLLPAHVELLPLPVGP